MRKYVILSLFLNLLAFLIFAQDKKEVSGVLDKITKTSITVNGKVYPISEEVIVKEKDGTVIKEETERLNLNMFRAVERVRIVIFEEKVKEIIIEVRRE